MEWIEKSNIFFRWTFFLLKIYLFYQLWNWSLRSHTSHIDASTGTERTNHLLQYQFVYITTIKQYYKPKPSKDYAIAVHLALCNFLIWKKTVWFRLCNFLTVNDSYKNFKMYCGMYSYDCQSNWGVSNFKIRVILSFLQEYNLAYIYSNFYPWQKYNWDYILGRIVAKKYY